MEKLSLMEVLSGIEDARRSRSVMYPLHEVLIIMLLAVVCGATSYAKVEMFGQSKQEWLQTFWRVCQVNCVSFLLNFVRLESI